MTVFACACYLRLIVLSVGLLILTPAARAANYYISAQGQDGSSGTSPAQAWQTLARANKHMFRPGDRLLLRGGDMLGGNLVFDAADAGTPQQPVEVASYGRGAATIAAGLGTAVLVHNAGGFLVRNLIVQGQERHLNKGSGIEFRNDLPAAAKLRGITIDNVQAHGFGQHGIFVHGAPADNSLSGYEDVRITNCRTFDNLYTGLYLAASYVLNASTYAHRRVYVAGCVAYDNSGDPTFLKNHSGSGLFISFVDSAVVERCRAYNNGFDCHASVGGPIGIWAYASNRVLMQYNESDHNRTGTGSNDGGGFDFDGGVTNSVFQYNYAHDNDGAGFLLYVYPDSPYSFHHNVVRYNISQNDGRRNVFGAIHVADGGGAGSKGVSDIEVYNNTIFISPSAAGGQLSGITVLETSRVRVFNNVLISTGGRPLVRIRGNDDLQAHHNLYWAGGSPDSLLFLADEKLVRGLTTWRAAAGLAAPASDLTADPRLSAAGQGLTLNQPGRAPLRLRAYRPKSSSPVRRAGAALPSGLALAGPAQDFGGRRVSGAAPDLGACRH